MQSMPERSSAETDPRATGDYTPVSRSLLADLTLLTSYSSLCHSNSVAKTCLFNRSLTIVNELLKA